MTEHEYVCPQTGDRATLSVPEGFDPPPTLQVPLVTTLGTGYEQFELEVD